MTTALVFPGQGSQAVGMGKALADAFPAAAEVFARVDAALGEKLSKVIFEGPEAELTLTANAQPALMATSLAALRALESEAGLDVARDAAFVAGHSLGEYSALVRGRRADAGGRGAAAAHSRRRRCSGPFRSAKARWRRSSGSTSPKRRRSPRRRRATSISTGAICEAANDNGGGQVVISGTKAAVERAMELAKLKGAKRALPLPVSAPFHCALMQPGGRGDGRSAGDKRRFCAPKVPLVANVSASADHATPRSFATISSRR